MSIQIDEDGIAGHLVKVDNDSDISLMGCSKAVMGSWHSFIHLDQCTHLPCKQEMSLELPLRKGLIAHGVEKRTGVMHRGCIPYCC